VTGIAGIVMVVSLALSLILALRAFRSHRLEFDSMAWMAAAWMAIIGVTAFVFGAIGG